MLISGSAVGAAVLMVKVDLAINYTERLKPMAKDPDELTAQEITELRHREVRALEDIARALKVIAADIARKNESPIADKP